MWPPIICLLAIALILIGAYFLLRNIPTPQHPDRMTTESDKNRLAQSQLKAWGFYAGKIDGDWGTRSQAAAAAWIASLSAPAPDPQSPATPPQPAAGTLDPRTEANIATLIPRAQIAARAFMAAAVPAMAAHGVIVRIIAGLRTYAEQSAIYAQGRTKSGPKVTNAPAGYSWHNFGVAWDIGLFKDGLYLDDSPLYNACAEIGRSQGLDCGAFWKSITDEPHFQLANLPTLAEAREIHDGGHNLS